MCYSFQVSENQWVRLEGKGHEERRTDACVAYVPNPAWLCRCGIRICLGSGRASTCR